MHERCFGIPFCIGKEGLSMAISIALAGNPNCGKTTLFNHLTGSRQHVGNWVGVTVEHKTGFLSSRFGMEARITDLPGAYSLNPQSGDEAAARDFLSHEAVDVILNIADATALERSLHLTLQLLRLNRPMVLALNMVDEAEKLGVHLNPAALEKALGIPVSPICARTGDGVDLLMCRVLRPLVPPSPPVYTAAELAAIGCMQPSDPPLQKPDRWMLHPAKASMLFGMMMLGVFFLAFGSPGQWLSDRFVSLCEAGVSICSAVLKQLGIQGMLHGLIVDGALSGVSAVLGFLPTLLILFGLLSLLEDSGAMARMAFLMDPLLRRAGLSGRCFIPLMLGFGCSVPAVMSTRTLPSSRERNLAILMIPFIPCSAKAPVCAMLVQLLPAAYRFPTMAGLYGLGIGAAVFSAWLQNRLSPAKEVPFVLELPRYRLPSLRSVLCQLWQRVRDFLARAFGVILLSSVAIWFLQTFTLRLTPAPCLSDSMLGMMAAWLAHLFAPAGFGSLEASAALIAGLIAKENIAGVLGVLAGETPVFPTALSAFSFLVFAVLYAPCAAAFAAIRREAGTAHALLNALYQTTLAWLSAVLIFQLGRMAGL